MKEGTQTLNICDTNFLLDIFKAPSEEYVQETGTRCILNFGTRWMWFLSFHATYLWPLGCGPQHHFVEEVRRVAGPAWTWWQTQNLRRFQESKVLSFNPKIVT